MAGEKKKEITLGKLGLWVLGLIVLIVVISLIAGGGGSKTNNQSSQSTPTSTTSTPTSTPAPTQPKIGDEVYLRLPANDSGQTILLATDKKYYDEVLKTLMAKDYMGILSLGNEGKAFGVSNGTKVLVVDSAVGIRKVRIVKGVNPVDDDKVGLAGWVAMEWIVKQ